MVVGDTYTRVYGRNSQEIPSNSSVVTVGQEVVGDSYNMRIGYSVVGNSYIVVLGAKRHLQYGGSEEDQRRQIGPSGVSTYHQQTSLYPTSVGVSYDTQPFYRFLLSTYTLLQLSSVSYVWLPYVWLPYSYCRSYVSPKTLYPTP